VQSAMASKEEQSTLSAVMAKLERKEIHRGKLCRAGLHWFEFIRALDGLYCANLTAANALQYGATVMEEIDVAIASSTWLQNLFAECIPSSISHEGRDYLMKIYHSLILPSYSRMRGRDVVRRIKARRSTLETLSDGLATRTKVQAATLVARSKNEMD